MSIEQHHPTPAIGILVTVISTLIGWAADIEPVLRVISLLVAITAGSMTALWYYKQLRAHVVVAAAILEAEKIKASAKLVAEALAKEKQS